MKRVKRVSSFALILVLLGTMFLSACGSSDGNDSGKSDGGKKTVLEFWTFAGLHEEFYLDAAESWNKEHPDRQIELKSTVYPFADMHDKLLIAIQSGVGAPDIVDIEIGKFANYLKGDNPGLEPLDDLIANERSNFVESRLEIYSKNGRLYGFPTHVGATVMYYNKEILDQAGVKVEDIVTWDDYIEAGKKVLAATGKPMGTAETLAAFNFQPMVLQQDSDYFDKDGNVIVDNPTNIKTLEFILSMMEQGVLVEAPGGQHHAEEYYGFMNNGGAASIMMPMWYMGRFLEYMPDLKNKIVIRPMPAMTAGGKRSAGIGGTGTSVPSQSKNKELAKEFLKYAKASKEANIKIWTILGFDPPRWDVWDDPVMKNSNKYTDYFGTEIFDTLLSFKDEINSPHMTEQYPAVGDHLGSKTMFNVLKEKTQTAAEALKAVADEVKKQ